MVTQHCGCNNHACYARFLQVTHDISSPTATICSLELLRFPVWTLELNVANLADSPRICAYWISLREGKSKLCPYDLCI